MIRLKSKTVLTLIAVSSFGVINTVYAPEAHAIITPDGKVDQSAWQNKFDTNNPATWNQAASDYPRSKLTGEKMFGSNLRFPLDSCMVQSYTKVLLQSGQKPWGTNAADVHDEAYEKGFGQGNGGFFNYAKADWGGGLKMNTALSGQGRLSHEDSIRVAREEWKKGNYVLFWCHIEGGRHIFNLDYIAENGDIIITDTSTVSLKLEDAYNKGTARYLEGVVILEPIGDTPKSNEGISITQSLDGKPVKIDGSVGVTEEVETSRAEEINSTEHLVVPNGAKWAPDESLIPNMPSEREWQEFYEQMASAGDGTQAERQARIDQIREDFKEGSDPALSIAKWKDEVESATSTKLTTGWRRFFTLIGLGVSAFAVAFPLLFTLAMTTPAGDKWFKALTKGKFIPIGSKEYLENTDSTKGKKVVYLTYTNVILYTAVAVILALLLLTGHIYTTLELFLNFVADVWTEFGGLFR